MFREICFQVFLSENERKSVILHFTAKQSMEEQNRRGFKPQIAVVCRNTLAANGLASLIESVMPMVGVCVFNSIDEICGSQVSGFFHFFISAGIFVENRDFFMPLCHKTIIVTEGGEHSAVPACFRTLDATLDSRSLLREFLKMEQMAHGGGRGLPENIRRNDGGAARAQELTPREVEVLRELVTGHINKEIADRLNISTTTVITHRRNIMEKLHAKSVATLAIYAVMHGIVPPDKI